MRNFIILLLLLCSVNPMAIAQNNWAQKTSLPSNSRYASTSFVLDEFAYIIGGQENPSLSNYSDEVWKYDPSSDSWTQMNDFPITLYSGSSFVLDGEAYVGLGNSSSGLSNIFYKYDPITDSWTNISTFPGGGRYGAVSFEINNKGYICTGAYLSDLWVFDPILNSWTQKANLPSSGRKHATGFALNGKGYLTNGKISSGLLMNDTWEYDPILDTWSQQGNIGTSGRTVCTSFIINNTAYCTTGVFSSGINNDEIWAYNSISGTWSFINNISNLPNLADRRSANGFSISDTAYVFGGYNTSSLNDLWSFVGENVYTSLPIDTTVCDIYTSPSQNYSWEQSGLYTDTVGNTIYSIDLEVDTIIPSISSISSDTLMAFQNNATYQWINCEDNMPILGETNQVFSPSQNGSYAVIISYYDCIDTSLCISAKAVNTLEYENHNINIYPNPSLGIFHIQSGQVVKEIKVYNSFGKMVEFKREENQIELSNPVNGLYFIELITENNNRFHRKIIIKN